MAPLRTLEPEAEQSEMVDVPLMVRRWLSPRYAHTSGASYSLLTREKEEMEHPSIDAAPVSLIRIRGEERVRGGDGVEGVMVRERRCNDPTPAWKRGDERGVVTENLMK